MDPTSRCIGICVASLRGEDTHGDIAATRQDTDPFDRQSPMSIIAGTQITIDEGAIYELDKLPSIPLDYLVLKVLYLEH